MMGSKEIKGFEVPDCRRFNGFKPCRPYELCPCADPAPSGHRILIVNLDYIGSVLMNTALLKGIRRKHKVNTIHWLTKSNAASILLNNPYIERVWEWNDENRMILRQMTFDTVLNADKNQNSAAFVMDVRASEKLGFGLQENGAIVSLNPEANYAFRMGIDDELKFRKNRRTALDILAEAWKIDYRRDPYVLELTESEKEQGRELRVRLGIPEGRFVVGFNTGCSTVYSLKKLTVSQHVDLIRMIRAKIPDAVILLLGGAEDTERNRAIKQEVGNGVIETPTTEGLRNGILSVNLCDLVVSGDSLGMHLAIALKKWVVAWFGISCASEIEMYDRGDKIKAQVDCSPCWKRNCEDPRCLNGLDVRRLAHAVVRYHRMHGNRN